MLLWFFANPSITLAQLISDHYIVIDPGHGGYDPGSPGYNGGAYPDEKDFTLSTAENIDIWISDNNLGMVVRTRVDDATLDFDERALIADGIFADELGRRVENTEMLLAFISVHYNADDFTSPRGTDIYCYTDHSVVVPEDDGSTSCEGLIFAGNLINTIQDSTEGSYYYRNGQYVFFDARTHNADGTAGILGNNWGIFNAIQYGTEPWFAAVLVEFEFITNPDVWEIVEPIGVYYDTFYHARAGWGVVQGWVDYFDFDDTYEFLSSVSCEPFLGRIIPLPENLTLENMSVGDTKVYIARSSITAGPSFIVESTGDVTFRAGSVITLKPGFHATAGSKFHAYIDAGLLSKSIPVVAIEGSGMDGTGPSTDNKTDKSIPTVYSLSPAYPNPFNPTTTIRFGLPTATNIEFIVYDLLGREVDRLLDRQLDPGYYQVVWRGRDARGRSLPSGVYIARLVTPQYTKSIKMLLLK